jgi:outer membrane lipoprotein-sorting protein
MSELAHLLELLHGAAGQTETVQSRWRVWRHDEHGRAAVAAHAKRSGAQSYATGRREDGAPAEHEERTRFWWQRPDSIRLEPEGPHHPPGHPTLVVRVGTTWWSYSPRTGAMTNEGDEHQSQGAGDELLAMLDPAAFIGLLDLEVTGRGERARRPVLLVTARPRTVSRRDPFGFALHHLGLGADEYTLEVDAQRGVLLRVEARVGGHAFQVTEAVEIAFDAALDHALFRFTPPPGEETRPVHAVYGRRRDIPLHEAAAAAPFTVHIPDEMAAD